MKKILQLALGIIAAVGGFVDIGDLVFNAGAGAKFGYSLLWALLVGTIGIVVYAEMSGRVVSVAKKTSFDLIREQYPPKLGFFTLSVSTVSNFLTCAAEIGGIALILHLLTAYSYQLLIVVALIGMLVIIWFSPLENLERLFGYFGIGLVIFVVAALKTWPGTHTVVSGLVPHGLGGSDLLSYLYFAVGIIAATLVPYEVYFYSSGGVEDKWKPEDAKSTNRMNAVVGFGIGAIVAAGVLVTAANVLGPRQIEPQLVGTTALSVVTSLGSIGLLLAMLGMLFAIGGAAVETSFAGAYNLCQFAGWKWGKNEHPLAVPRFTWSWIIMLVLAAAVIFTGIDPVALTEYAVIFSVVVMPLTYWPVLHAARNRELMGKYVNGRWANALGTIFLAIIVVVALAAVPLMFITNHGQ